MLAILLFLPFLAWSQEAEQQRVPATLTSDVPEVVAGETSRVNQLTAAFTFSTVYDDNIQSARTNHMSDWRFNAAPSIRIDETRPQLHWDVEYEAGVSRYLDLPVGTQSSHNFTGSFEYKPVSRLKIRLRQDYLRAMDPFSIIENRSLGVVNSPNQTIVAPSAVRTVLTSQADLQYGLSPHSSIGVTGTFIKSHYSNATSDSTPFNPLSGQTLNGSLYYSAKLSPRGSVGVQYVVADMTYDHSSARVQTHSFLGFTTLGFDAHSTLMLWGGPELTRSGGRLLEDTLPAIRREWNPAFGAVYTWLGSRTDIGISASRRVTDGGGVMDAAAVTTGTLSLGRRLSRNWTGRSSITLARNRSTGFAASPGVLRSLFGALSIERQITRNVLANVAFDRVYQDGTGTYAAIGNHNRLQLSIRYSFSRPLGK